jgi:magnesium-transporting ATPase (P-type)
MDIREGDVLLLHDGDELPADIVVLACGGYDKLADKSFARIKIFCFCMQGSG